MTKFANLPALLLLAMVLWPCPSPGQSLSVGGDKTKPPIDVQAENGIEWQRSNKIIKAMGNAHAVRGDLDVTFRWEFIEDLSWRLSFYDSFDSNSSDPEASSNDYGVNTTISWDF